MRQATDLISPFFQRKNIFFAEQPGEYSRVIVKKVAKLVKKQLGFTAPIKGKILERRFPIDALIWRNLLTNAPSRTEELLRNRNSDLLIWLKTDKNCKRLKIQVLRPLDKHEATKSCCFSVTSLEPVPVESLKHYAGIITLFILVHSAPCVTRKKQAKVFADFMCHLLPELNQELSQPMPGMPRSFIKTALRLQAWIWFYTGSVHEDKARLGRAARSYDTLLSEWPGDKKTFEYGQTLSNMAALSLNLAHLSSDAESYEQTLDRVKDAQTIFPRLQHPVLWAQLQEIKAEAQYNLGERHGDLEYYETSIHTFLTVRKIWRIHNKPQRLSRTLKRLGKIYGKLGYNLPGSERHMQSLSAFREAASHLATTSAPELKAEINLEITQTLIVLGQRLSSEIHLHEAIKQAKATPYPTQETQTQSQLLEAQARIQVGQNNPDTPTAKKQFAKAVKLLNPALVSKQNLTDRQIILGLELRGICLEKLGENDKADKKLEAAAHDFRQAIDLIQNQKSISSSNERAYTNLPGLYEKLALNRSLLSHKHNSKRLLEESGALLLKSLDLVSPETHPQKWSLLQHQISENFIRQSHYAYGRENDLLDQAVRASHKALSTLQKKQSPQLWAQMKQRLAEALTLSAAHGGGTPCLEMALEAYEKVLECEFILPASLEKAALLTKMANVMADLGRREAISHKLEKAQKIMTEAQDLYHAHGQHDKAQNIQTNIAALNELLKNNCTLTTTQIFDNLDYTSHFSQTLQ